MKNVTLIFVFITFTQIAFASDDTKRYTLNEEANVAFSHDVFFNTDKHALTTEEFKKLLNFIETAKDVDVDRMSIVGFCDDIGTEAYNQTLSDKRAHAIRDIIAQYINSDKGPEILKANGKGEIQLSTSEKVLFDGIRGLNRKVTIVVAPKKIIAGSFYGEDIKSGFVVNLKSLKFKKGLRHLTKESIAPLKELADYLVKNKNIYFAINGHVCCTENGAESRDVQTGEVNLSLVRAKYIRNYLIRKGVDAKRVNYKGLKGKYNLGGDASDDRRVELLIRYVAAK